MSTTELPLTVNLPLDTTRTILPLIADGTLAHVRLKNVSQGEREGNAILKWEMTLIDPAPGDDGHEIQAGFPLFINFDVSKEFLVQKMARFVDGFLGTGDANNRKGKPPRPAFNADTVSRMLGAEGYAKVTIRRGTGDFIANDITSIIHPADLTTPAA
jgi:hypothetical protein